MCLEGGAPTRKVARRRQLVGEEGEWAQKWGCNDDNDEYGAGGTNDPTINYTTIETAARGDGAASDSDHGNGNKMGPQ